MPYEPYTRVYSQLAGGINNSKADEFVADNELSDARNYIPDDLGAGDLITREGITRESTVQTEQITSIFQGKNANYFSTSTTLRNLAGTSLSTGLTSHTNGHWASFAAYDIFVNGTEARKTSDGSTFTAVSNIPSGTKYVAAANNFLFAAGHDKGRLRWAELGVAETWPATNELILTQDEADNVLSLIPFSNGILVNSDRSFFHVIGYSSVDMEVTFASREEGCAASRSVLLTPAGVFWWSKAGLVRMGEDFRLDYPMVRKLQGTLNGLNRAQDGAVHGVYWPQKKCVRYFLFNGASQTTVNLALDYYYEEDAFYLHSGAGVNMAASGMILRSGQPKVYVGGYAASTYVFEAAGNTDDGTNMAAYYETKREAYYTPSATKIGRDIHVSTNLTAAATVTYGYYLDNDTALTASHNLTPGTGGVETYLGINRLHRKIKHRIAATAATRTRIYGIVHDGDFVRAAG